MITRFAIVTLVLFFLSTIFIIHPLSFHVPFPVVGRRKVTIGLMTAPIMAIAILWASQCLGATQIRNGIVGTGNIKPYNILILFISLAYMAITLDVTGILQAAAFWVSNKGGSNGRKLYFYFYLLLTVISMIVGNNPAILSGTGFLVYYTAATWLHPDAWLISEFAAANTASMVLFVGNPTNVIICEGFRINNAAFTAYTILPFVACSIVCYLVLMLQYRDEKHISKKLNVPAHPNPRGVMRDLAGAIVSSIWLATCLIVAIVLSFFDVEIWKVVLPFAGGKFIFDIIWDHNRYPSETHQFFPSPIVDSSTEDPISSGNNIDTRNESLQLDTRRSGPTTVVSNNIYQRAPAPATPISTTSAPESALARLRHRLTFRYQKLAAHFPTFFTALPRLPLILIPFSFSQFILIEALAHQGWIDLFARWFVIASKKQIIPVVWLVGVFEVILSNISGTSIGATILLTKVIQASDLPESTFRAAAVSLAVASNIGAVSFTSASLGGLLWIAILKDKGVELSQWRFAVWNALPLVAMMVAGLGVVSAMMAVLY